MGGRRRVAEGLAALGLLSALCVAEAEAASALIQIGNGTAASCTEAALRSAVTTAANRGGGLIYFRCGAAPVVIPMTEDLIVPNHTTINGGGLVTLHAPRGELGTLRLISVAAGSTVVITDLGINGYLRGVTNAGDLTLNSTTVGGANWNDVDNSGTLTIVNSEFSGGAGIMNHGALVVYNTVFTENFGNHFFGVFRGGAIDNGGTATVSHCSFSRNRQNQGLGGSIGNHGTMIIRHSSFADGTAVRGGEIYNEGSLTIIGSSITGAFAGIGGGIDNAGGNLIIVDTTITGNEAPLGGGGIYSCCGGELTMIHTTVTANTPDNVLEGPGPIPE
jgi:hypothetical protein